jgi:AcrR family transcriptional regulator
MLDIADHAKVTRPTVYRYFETCGQLHREVIKRQLLLTINRALSDSENENSPTRCLTATYRRMHVLLLGKDMNFLREPGMRKEVDAVLIADKEFRKLQSAMFDAALKKTAQSPATAYEFETPIICEIFDRFLVLQLITPSKSLDQGSSQRLLEAVFDALTSVGIVNADSRTIQV